MELDYRKTSAELVFDLINRDNPDLPIPLSDAIVTLGSPVVITGQGIRNTRISVSAKAGSPYTGTINLTYRRLTGTVLFQQGLPQIDEYAMPADLNGTQLRVESICRWVNQKYGLALTLADFTGAYVSNTVGNKPLTFVTNNPAWIGTIVVQRLAAKKPVSEQIPEVTPALLTFVSGQPSGGAPGGVADFGSYQADFSKFSPTLNAFTTLTTLPKTKAMREVINYLSIVLGRSLSLETAAAEPNGMEGSRIIRYALPNVNVPEANSVDYTHVAIISPPAAGGSFVGRYLLHYKV